MHYEHAFYRIAHILYQNCGGPYSDPTKSLDLSSQDDLGILIKRFLEMREHVKENKLTPFEVSRFMIEYDLVTLLLVIYLFGESGNEVPLTEQDIQNVGAEVSNTVVAGYSDMGIESVYDIALRIFKAGCGTFTSPKETLLLLDSKS